MIKLLARHNLDFAHASARCVHVRIVLAVLAVLMSGCSPGYVVRAAYEQSKILLARRPIQEVIQDPTTSREDSEKLTLVLDARSFASEIGLNPGGSFTQYSDVGKDTLAWVVMASRKDSFALHTWWFPIVGTVPYKGFFGKEDAHSQARQLEAEGYESSVRGTDAFSTLGWFNDPLLSTTLKGSPIRIVNTVIHESVHSTVWIPDHVAFNESLANFVGSRAAVDFFRARLDRVGDRPTDAPLQSAVHLAEREHQISMDFADYMSQAYHKLSELYQRQDLTSEQKIDERQRVFVEVMAPFRSRYPRSATVGALNNAELLQSTIYMTRLRMFEKLFLQVNQQWPGFFKHIVELKQQRDSGVGADPFALLEAMVSANDK
jgi:predicted aminopeptidase